MGTSSVAVVGIVASNTTTSHSFFGLFGSKKGDKEVRRILMLGGSGVWQRRVLLYTFTHSARLTCHHGPAGTQCSKLVDKYNIVHISTGDLLRSEIKAGTAVGQKVAKVMQSGGLVDSDTVMEILRKRLDQDDVTTRGWLGDGWARERATSEALLKSDVTTPGLVLVLDVPREILIGRLTGRRKDPITGKIYNTAAPGFQDLPQEVKDRLQCRADDTRDAAENRLDIFEKQSGEATTRPFEAGGVAVLHIDGLGSPDQVFARIVAEVDCRYKP